MVDTALLVVVLAILILTNAPRAWRAVRRFTRRRDAKSAAVDASRDYGVRTAWAESTSELNYSTFVFLDKDRDGEYGSGDEPLAGIVVRLTGEQGLISAVPTNAAGFANFPTSTRKKGVPIRKPGGYTFEVAIPPDWASTNAHTIQRRDFRLIPGSPSGIGTEEMLRPVGLSPHPVVRGALGDEPGWIASELGGAVIERTDLEAGAPFHYRVPDSAEAVTIGVELETWRLDRLVFPVDLGTIDPRRRRARSGGLEETIGFESVTSRGLKKIPSGYAGLGWFNLNAMAKDYSPGSEGYVNGSIVGDYIAYTSSGHPAEFWSDTPFDFMSVALSVAWKRAEGEVATIESWQGDELIARDRVPLSALGPVYYRPTLRGVTRVRLSTEHYWQMVVDELRVVR